MTLRTLALGVPLAAAALALLLADSGSAAPRSVAGTVGPGFTISLELGGKPATRLTAGVPYRFVVSDRSSIHNYRLRGPGVNRELTTVPFTGTKSAVFRLRKGSYTFVCDPHASVMRGSFRVS
jgi:plastocyanin